MIELLALLPLAAIGALVWRRKAARLDALLLAHAVAGLAQDSGREVRVEGGRGGWYVAWLDADGVLLLRRFGRAAAARAAAQALAEAATPACHGALDLSEYLPAEQAGADMRQAVVAFCATAGTRQDAPAAATTAAAAALR
ncbi:hypothetical protein [Derxia lacustris]|uniref:hypothetical protein n=1 Tax=Derxia lacustris TaxID=764842 RepID=UPI000A1716A0|nr:hypothetical protein [Derxia lacustris]